jgi:hypothetical protein
MIMKTRTPFLVAASLSCSLLFLSGQLIAQNGPPFGAGGPGGNDRGEPGGPPSWAGGPPPWAGGPPSEPAPPREDNGDNGDDGNGDDDIPDFCASPGAGQGPSGQAGLSSIAHLNFSQIDPDTGEALEEGASARIMYRWIAPLFDYVINVHKVEPNTDYTLTYQPEPMPTSGVICLGTSTANPGGNMNLQDAFDIATDLPAAYDENEDEAQLVVVLAEHVDCEAGEMLEWEPEHYLFGDEGMFYVNPDLEDNGDDNGGNGDDNGDD